ncbi:hypothetical protein R3P38DRAFT_273539 [Favolaschia claudopus]|uniref:Uncharacterized protein n=1 Tax=Favolaschia claudopus TaxID=2862362 RepID=A0AAV9ZR10_9AGAR
MFSVFTLVLSAQAVIAATTPQLLGRQSVQPGLGCTSACSPLLDDLASTDATAKALCTPSIVRDYGQCYDCLVAADTLTVAEAQETVDQFVSGCKAAGVPVSGVTISGSSGGGTPTGGSTPTSGSGSQSTATTTAGGSSNGSSSGSSSSSNSSGSNSGSSGKSDNDSDSSDSSNGGFSGSGFRSNDATHHSMNFMTYIFIILLGILSRGIV